MKIARTALFVSTFVIVGLSAASAQGTAEERSACMGDAFRFCSSDIPNVSAIEACLKQNVSKLNASCRAEFEPQNKSKLHPRHFADGAPKPQ